jgi:predicted transcriptional regulator
MKSALFIDCTSADELAKVRADRQLKLIAAIMSHPSYKPVGQEGQTTQEGADRVERIPGR